MCQFLVPLFYFVSTKLSGSVRQIHNSGKADNSDLNKIICFLGKHKKTLQRLIKKCSFVCVMFTKTGLSRLIRRSISHYVG